MEVVDTPRGRVAFFDDGTGKLIARISATPHGDRYFFYPRLAMLPFLTGREQASKYDVFDYTSPSQYQEACISAVRHAAWLVIDRNWLDPEFLRGHYPAIPRAEPPEVMRLEQALQNGFELVAREGALELRRRVKTMDEAVCASIAEETAR
jgi:hypothetical protein